MNTPTFAQAKDFLGQPEPTEHGGVCKRFKESKKLIKKLEAERKEAKAPHLQGGRDVDSSFKPLIGKLEGVKDKLLDQINAWRSDEAEYVKHAEEFAGITFRSRSDLEIDMETLLQAVVNGDAPLTCIMANKSVLASLVKSGMQIPGVTVIESEYAV